MKATRILSFFMVMLIMCSCFSFVSCSEEEVDAIEAEYISKLGELKTKAEWEQEVPPTSESDSTKEDPKSGWIFAVIGAVVLLAGAATTVALIINKNKNPIKDLVPVIVKGGNLSAAIS